MNSFSNMQEWVDSFANLNDYSRVSIDTWYKMRPAIQSYPGTISAIRPGFDDSIIDDSIFVLATETDPNKIELAKSQLTNQMRDYFSLPSDSTLVDMNPALDKKNPSPNPATASVPPADSTPAPVPPAPATPDASAAAATVSPTPAVPPTPAVSPAPTPAAPAKFSNGGESIDAYIASKYALKEENVAKALDDLASRPFPLSHKVINNILCNRYHFPINNDGEVVSKVADYLKNHIEIDDAKMGQLKLASRIINKSVQAGDFLVMDILNAYMDPKISQEALPGVLDSLFKSERLDVPMGVINKIILDLSDGFKSYDMQREYSSKNYSRSEVIHVLSETCKDHRLKLAANEIKWLYDFMINNKLDVEKTANALVGVMTESGRTLYPETAIEIIKDFKERVRTAHLSDGFLNFSHINFNKIADSAYELSESAVQAGIDDKFIFDHYDELAELLMKSQSSRQLVGQLADFFLASGYAVTEQEAKMIADDFFHVLKDTDWAKRYMRLNNFSRNDVIDYMFSLGYTDRDIAIKLHQPLGVVKNFSSHAAIGPIDTFIDNLRNNPFLHWMSDDRYKFLKNLVGVLTALGVAYTFIWPHLKSFYYKLTNQEMSDAEKYDLLVKELEQNNMYKYNSGRIAQAMIELSKTADLPASTGPKIGAYQPTQRW